jgi:hypothetical protein
LRTRKRRDILHNGGDFDMRLTLHHSLDEHDETTEAQRRELHEFVEILMPMLEKDFTLKTILPEKSAGPPKRKKWKLTGSSNGVLIIRFFPSSVPFLFDLGPNVPSLDSTKESPIRVFLLTFAGDQHEEIAVHGEAFRIEATLPRGELYDVAFFVQEVVTQRMAGVSLARI